MKRIAYSFLLIFLLSCGSNAPTEDNRVTLQLRDSLMQDYFLLSMRDHAVVVAPYTEDEVTSASLAASARIIPFEKIGQVYCYSRESTGSTFLPGLCGLLLGTGAGCAAGGYAMKDEGDFGPLIGGGLIGGIAGLAAGIIIHNAINKTNSLIPVDIFGDVRELNKRAFYEQEPAELHNIR